MPQGNDDALAYASEILVQSADALLELAQDFANPTDRIIIPTIVAIAKVLYDATLIAAAHAPVGAVGDPAFANLDFPRQAMLINNQLYHDALNRMRARAQAVEAPVQAF